MPCSNIEKENVGAKIIKHRGLFKFSETLKITGSLIV